LHGHQNILLILFECFGDITGAHKKDTCWEMKSFLACPSGRSGGN